MTVSTIKTLSLLGQKGVVSGPVVSRTFSSLSAMVNNQAKTNKNTLTSSSHSQQQFSPVRSASTLASSIPSRQHSIHQKLIHQINVHFQRRFMWSHSQFRRGRGSQKYYKEEIMQPSTVAKPNPFAVLGLPQTPETTYAAVKGRFLKLAMQNHPDTMHMNNAVADDDDDDDNAPQLSPEEQDARRETFIRVRQAFEAIAEGPNGVAILRDEADNDVEAWKQDELNSWFKDQSGMDMPFLDLKTMHEVAKMTQEIGGDAGLDRDGGMWTLARMVSKDVNEGGDGSSILQLAAGKEKNRHIDGHIRRKRRR